MREIPVEFNEDRAYALPWLLISNQVLGLVTLGIYRFWAKTALRRHFWARVCIDDEPLEYTGRGRELFVGFLIVMAVFVPLSVGYSALQAILIDDRIALGLFSALYSILLFLLMQAATYRARRYRLSRTVWRGIRAGQTGSTWRYVGLSVLWAVPVLLSAGLALPWAATVLARYRMEHSFWGDFRGAFSGLAFTLFRAWLPIWLFCIACVGLLGYGMRGTDFYLDVSKDDPVFAILGIIGAGFALGYLVFQAIWLRWYLGHSAFGPLRFTCNLRLGHILIYIVPAILIPMVYLGILAGLGFAASRHFANASIVIQLLVGFGGAVLGWSGLRILWVLCIHVPIMRLIVTSVSVSGLEAADSAQQSSAAPQRFGEGLADSFEIGIA